MSLSQPSPRSCSQELVSLRLGVALAVAVAVVWCGDVIACLLVTWSGVIMISFC